MSDYQAFLDAKRKKQDECGFTGDFLLNSKLFPFQEALTRWGIRIGRADIWADCGLGKTAMQLDWARVMHEKTNKNVLILAPLAVAEQTKREGEKFDIDVTVCREPWDVKPGINVANYERLHKFFSKDFGAIVCDEASILKSYDGKLRKQITDFAMAMPFRLGCSATPAPNDYMEFGTQSEFIGSLSRQEMLAMFFVHDGGETSKWRLKKHAEDEFWKWVSTWAAYVRAPSNLGFEDNGFVLPPLNVHHHILESSPAEGQLFAVEASTLNERRAARRASLSKRVAMVAEMANASKERWVVWCDFNAESKALSSEIIGAQEVTGSMPAEQKEEILGDFSAGRLRVIVSKPSIAGFGLNWQHCHNMAFVGLSDSYEQYYQATRRCWRFGQQKPVEVHIVTSEAESATVKNIQRKEKNAERMAERIAIHMKDLMRENVVGVRKGGQETRHADAEGEGWTAILGDCVTALKNVPDSSVDYSIYSPPFASLYTYSDSLADMGNCLNHSEFYEHFKFFVAEQFRVTKLGRLVSFHCMNLPTSKERDGVIGITDFRGELIRIFQQAGFIFASEVCIWKDPVTSMHRTKALGLLYKQLRKDSCMSRQGIPDYLVTMRKPGTNTQPVTKTHESFPVSEWQHYASPVWMDINPSETLQKASAREEQDERHICPLQLEVIRRSIRLWSNHGDLVLSPFMGIGSEGYIALQMGRRFLGIELKESYFNVAVENLKEVVRIRNESSLFVDAPETEEV
jgi:DNA modification methylase